MSDFTRIILSDGVIWEKEHRPGITRTWRYKMARGGWSHRFYEPRSRTGQLTANDHRAIARVLDSESATPSRGTGTEGRQD